MMGQTGSAIKLWYPSLRVTSPKNKTQGLSSSLYIHPSHALLFTPLTKLKNGMKAARKNKIAPESTNKAVARKLQEKITVCSRSTNKGGARKLQEKKLY